MKRLALAALAFLATTTSAMAVEAILLAPTQFARPKGRPQTQTASFVAREDGFAHILLTNGSGDGQMAVRSATVSVNGIAVFVPTDFDPRFDTMIEDAPVSEGPNELTVDLRGAPGDFVTISVSQEVEVCPPGIEQCQGVTPIPTTQSATPNSALTIDVEYSASSPELAGIGVKVHWDSSQLHFDGTSNVFPLDFVAMTGETDDVGDSDGDPNTDKIMNIAWVDTDEHWPGVNFQTLMTLNFTTAPGFSTSTQVNFSASLAPGYQFFSTSALILASP